MRKRKMLPKVKAPRGLYLYCDKHKAWYKHDDKVKCKCDLKYKAKIHISGTKNLSRCKTFVADNLEAALIEFFKFKREMKETNFLGVKLEKAVQKPVFLTDCQQEFIDFKNDVGVPFHEKKNLPRRNIRGAERSLEYFNEALMENGIRPDVLPFDKLNSKIVGITVQYFLEEKGMANRTFNNEMAPLKSFVDYIINNYYPNMTNPFKKVEKLTVNTEKKVVSRVEFMAVVNRVSPENLTVKETNSVTGKTKNRSYYRDWLVDGFYIAMLGGRNEEVTNIKWSDIKLNEEGKMSYIEVVDLKRTKTNKRRSKLEKDIAVVKRIQMTPELEDMLRSWGYEDKKGKDEFILAPKEKASRKHMSDLLSKAFNILYDQLGLPEKKQFKHLRKTYATKCYVQDPENFYEGMGHTNQHTTLKHYVDMATVMEERRKLLYAQKGR